MVSDGVGLLQVSPDPFWVTISEMILPLMAFMGLIVLLAVCIQAYGHDWVLSLQRTWARIRTSLFGRGPFR